MYIHKFEKYIYSVDMNSVVDKNSGVDQISGVAKNTLVDENLVVCRSSEKTIDKNSVVVHFSGVDQNTWSLIFFYYLIFRSNLEAASTQCSTLRSIPFKIAFFWPKSSALASPYGSWAKVWTIFMIYCDPFGQGSPGRAWHWSLYLGVGPRSGLFLWSFVILMVYCDLIMLMHIVQFGRKCKFHMKKSKFVRSNLLQVQHCFEFLRNRRFLRISTGSF